MIARALRVSPGKGVSFSSERRAPSASADPIAPRAATTDRFPFISGESRRSKAASACTAGAAPARITASAWAAAHCRSSAQTNCRCDMKIGDTESTGAGFCESEKVLCKSALSPEGMYPFLYPVLTQ